MRGSNSSRFAQRALRGDIELVDFGLSPAEVDVLAQSTTHIVHAAASVKLNMTIEQARSTAVRPTRTILDLARRAADAGALRKLDMVSTVGVWGRTPGAMPERPLPEVREFHNTYEEAKAEAERASLLKSRLLANVSHELRTPLNIILGYSQAALDDPSPYGVPLPAELVHDIHHIQYSGQQLGRLIDDLLNLAQVESGALEVYPEVVDCQTLLNETFHAMAGSTVQPDVEWRLQLPDTLPLLWVDPVRLRQVVLNLLSNAARFTVEGHITLGAAQGDDELRIWVEDTGVGIGLYNSQWDSTAAITAEAIVDGARAQHGAGLGLQVAQHLVALHNGTLSIHSRPGHGTLFLVCLPLHPAVEPAQPSAAVEAAGPASRELMLQACLERATNLSRALAAYVAEHHAAPISRDEISAALKVSPNYLSRIFRRDTGMTPWQYLNQYRVVQAQKLLLSSELSVTEVAQHVGFNDPAYFVRVFHKETGKAPLQYRKSAK